MPIDPISIFLSSPNDVQAERDRAKLACAELQAEPAIRQHFRLDAYAFEERVPPQIGDKPQQAVDRYMLRSEDADILVCILWSRVGSPWVDENGRQWASGTAYEFEMALQRYQRTGRRPVVLLYRCLREPPAGASAEGLAALEQYFGRFDGKDGGLQGIFHHRAFETSDEFAENLKRDLREVLEGFGRPVTAKAPAFPLDALANRVQHMWIDGVLRPSLEGRPPIPLPLDVPPGPHFPQGLADKCFTGVWLKSLFRESRRRLMLTAGPGAGKTLALLHLLQILLQEREIDAKSPVSVVLDATSWRENQNASDWILQELDRLYGARPRTAKEFVANKRLIYLIDGLDQIGMRSRSAGDPEDQPKSDPSLRHTWCRKLLEFFAANEWSVAQGTPVVLCCREEHLADFGELLEEGRFQKVIVKPPELAYIVNIVRADKTVVGLADELEQNPQLANLARVPLFLQMLISVFRGGSPYRPLAGVGEQEQIHELISSYVELRLAAESEGVRQRWFTIPQVRHWLTWLARNQNRSPFLIELMQPDMLPNPDRRLYSWLAAAALAFVLTAWGTIPVSIGVGIDWGFHEGWAMGLRAGLTTGLLSIPVCFLLSVLTFLWGQGRWFGFFIAFPFSIVRGITNGMACPEGNIPSGLGVGLSAGFLTWVVAAPLFMVFFHVLNYQLGTIRPLTNWNFDTRKARWGILGGVAVGAFFWLVFGPARGLSFGVLSGLTLTGILCLRKSGLDVPSQPNQGIVRSTWNALLISLSAVFIAAPIVAFSYAYEFGWISGLDNGVEALSVGFTCLIFGAVPALQHWTMRLICAWRDHLPLKLVPFLDSMTEMMLVQRVGGAYRFSHDLISGFFAGRKAVAEQH